MLQPASKPRRIAIVGNGPSAVGWGRVIDSCDLVVRINCATYCGRAGGRTDVLALANIASPARRMTSGETPIDPRALADAKEIWLTVHPRSLAEMRGVPFTGFHEEDLSEIVIQKVARSRPTVQFAVERHNALVDKLRSYGAVEPFEPSTGARVIEYVRTTDPLSEIVLFGFSHEGWLGHPWQAEKKWITCMPNVRNRQTKRLCRLLNYFS